MQEAPQGSTSDSPAAGSRLTAEQAHEFESLCLQLRYVAFRIQDPLLRSTYAQLDQFRLTLTAEEAVGDF